MVLSYWMSSSFSDNDTPKRALMDKAHDVQFVDVPGGAQRRRCHLMLLLTQVGARVLRAQLHAGWSLGHFLLLVLSLICPECCMLVDALLPFCVKPKRKLSWTASRCF
ncbi:uncharacterized protein PV06_03884 [Exophiala oligosperma]|uniref:Uncharacterized protein n=1 Tax=Exophiala oligosperma TaxID=215243 RepID=A0A0D2DRH3_9EURO|nr:uncharacterized protein PV06_03884 [Exophiala oligosperma]KIW45498.1 hypothetical protein PV06_03884 [Exophiala oligosperma]